MYLYTFIKSLHLLGVVVGFGGVVFTAMMAARSLKDEQLFKISPKIISLFSIVIWAGLVLLVATGVFLEEFWELRGVDLEKGSIALMVKKALVLLIAFHGFYVNLYLARKMKALAAEEHPFQSSGFKKFKILGMISTSTSLILWSAVIILGVWVTTGLMLK